MSSSRAMSGIPVKVLALLRTAVFFSIVVYGVAFWLPRRMGIFAASIADVAGWRWLGVIPLALGAAMTLYCGFAFAWTGEGTPAPFDAPRRLVVTGVYRYVRNPMYFGVALMLLGETFLLAPSIASGLVYLGWFLVATSVFVMLYEERALRAKFGAEYEEYCRNVHRWRPRLTPWRPAPSSRSATSAAK